MGYDSPYLPWLWKILELWNLLWEVDPSSSLSDHRSPKESRESLEKKSLKVCINQVNGCALVQSISKKIYVYRQKMSHVGCCATQYPDCIRRPLLTLTCRSITNRTSGKKQSIRSGPSWSMNDVTSLSRPCIKTHKPKAVRNDDSSLYWFYLSLN